MAQSFSLLCLIIRTLSQFMSLACYLFLSFNRPIRRIKLFVYGEEDKERVRLCVCVCVCVGGFPPSYIP
jgi:hypothetical protein